MATIVPPPILDRSLQQALMGFAQPFAQGLGIMGQRRLTQRDIQATQDWQSRQPARQLEQQPGFVGPPTPFPTMQSQMGRQAQLGGQLQSMFGDPFGVQRTKTELQAAQAGAALRAVPAGKQISATGLRKEFRSAPAYKKYQVTQRAEQIMEKALEFSREPGLSSRIGSDQALGVLFQKILDPESVVRESEYARTPEGAAVWNKIKAMPEKLLRGGLALTDEERMALVRIAKEVVNADKLAVNQLIDDYTYTANQYGVNPKWVVGNMTKFDIKVNDIAPQTQRQTQFAPDELSNIDKRIAELEARQ